ncbi:hypothetical protein BGX28_001307 [Mortierella sp. GBA30]|nr:hypothetical protein BGX28_001307 [Mortierella sp. GBA30]
MVLTRSKSNKGTSNVSAPVPTPVPKTTAPAKRKSNTSAASAAKAAKTDSAADSNGVSAAESTVADNDAVNEETLTKASVKVAKEPSEPVRDVTTPPAPTAPESSTIPAPVDVPVVAPTEPVVVSSEEPTVHKPLHPFEVIVSDIEGTTTPIVFVKENLFPYVTSKLAEFLKTNWENEEMKTYVEGLRVQTLVRILFLSSAEKVQGDVIASIKWQMKADRKIGALKAFQGYMWKEGYSNGDLKGVLYEDVIPAFDQWKTEGKKLYIYSSGSIAAQKLLFGYSEKGDLLHYFSGHYDTTIGQKVDAESYTKIAADIGVSPERILFLSDNIHEIVAAKKAGLQAVVTDRPGNAPLSVEDRDSNVVVKSFLDIPNAL